MSRNDRKFRLECLVKDLPNDRDLEVSLFHYEDKHKSGIRNPHQSNFTDSYGESHRALEHNSNKAAFFVNPCDLTQEECVKALKGTFVWGEVVAIHTVGEYQIVEYIDADEDGEHQFNGYIDWSDEHVSRASLDEALVGLIARKYEGSNSRSGECFFRMLDREDQA